MSDHTELDVFFKTTNKNPLQELRGIFNKQWDAVQVDKKGSSDFYRVCIHELSLIESFRILKSVQEHCHRNKRSITIVVVYGVIYDFDCIKLGR